MMLERGMVSQEQLQHALIRQRSAAEGRIGDWLQRIAGVSTENVTRALAAQWSRPVLQGAAAIKPEMALAMPASIRRLTGVLPLRVHASQRMYAAFTDQIDHVAVAALERMTGLHVESGIAVYRDHLQGSEVLDRAHGAMEKEYMFHDMDELSRSIVSTLFRQQPIASRLCMVHGVWWLRMWLEPAAIGHIGMLPASGEDVLDVLFRRPS